jgi:thiamine kinase-like enzyme
MDIKMTEFKVVKWAEENSIDLGLSSLNIEAKYIWNPGGFVNQSYRVSDGETVHHVKFAHARKAAHLQQWARISQQLTDSYHAPRLVQEVKQEVLPGYSYGLVFEFLEAKPLSSIANPAPIIDKILRKLYQLQTDKQIQQMLSSKKTQSYAEAFVEEYITRFEEDLEAIRAEQQLLDFVSESSIEWFYSEVELLKQLAGSKPCFQKQANAVVHNDINWENILVDANNDYWIIDWDEVTATGDSAMDYSVLLWPLYRTAADWPIWKEQVIGLAGEDTYERMEIYFRAKLLDEVIDVLADYVEAEGFLEVKEIAQKRAKEIHLHAYPEYLRHYK